MKIRDKILSLISCCILVTSTGVRQTDSAELFKTIRSYVNEGFRAIKYTGFTLSFVSGTWTIMSLKTRGIMDSIVPLVCTVACAGIGYTALKLEKLTEDKETLNDQKKGNENELLHSDSGVQSK